MTRGWRFKSVVEGNSGQGVEVQVVKWDGMTEGETKKVKAKYLVGCDGGHSSVRAFLEAHHGVRMNGDWVDTLWGAIDAVVKSDFPDLRKIGVFDFYRFNTFTDTPSPSGYPLPLTRRDVHLPSGTFRDDRPTAHPSLHPT